MFQPLISQQARRNWSKVIIVAVIMLILTSLYYPRRLEGALGIEDVTVDDIASISLYIRMPGPPSYMEMEGEEIRLENSSDPGLIDDVLIALSGHRLRKRHFISAQKIDYFPIHDHNQPATTDIRILLKDSAEPLNINVSYDARYVSVNRNRYKLYGAGIETRRLFETVKEKVGG